MFERFTERARQVVVLAQDESRSSGDDFIGAEHILLGLLREGGIAARILETRSVGLETTRTVVRRGRPEVGHPSTGQIPFTATAEASLEAGVGQARALGAAQVGTATLGRLVTIVHADDTHHAVFQRRP